MLCEKCKVIELSDQLTDSEEATIDGYVVLKYDGTGLELDFELWDTFPDLPGLEESAERGCGFCGLLRSTLQDILADQFAKHDNVDGRLSLLELAYECDKDEYWKDPNGQWEGLSHLRLLAKNSDDSLHAVFCFDVVADQGNFISKYLRIHRRPLLESDPLSNSNIETIHSWMKQCISHQFCGRDSFIPTRLIDLGDEIRPIRVIQTSEDPRFNVPTKGPESQYLALSYCWGRPDASRPPFKTTRGSLNSRMSEIHPEAVPKTIADAFTVARALNYHFIWIDALCIIQDDEADWQRESSLMRRIFGSAMMTIVAASSASSHDGFLSRRKAQLLPVSYRPSRHPERAGHFYLQRSANIEHASEFWRNTEAVEWNKRAWTFQEGLASQSLLIFGPMMLHFRCQQDIRAENTLAIRQPDSYGVSWSYYLQSPCTTLEAWYEVVRSYSGRKLTYPLDKLPALSALAHDMQERTGSQYLAGIWRHQLVWSLLWECVDLENDDFYSDIDPVRSEIYRAPSWSWAAGDGAVGWHPPDQPQDFKEEIIVEDAQTAVLGDDPLGRVAGGSLILTGKIQHSSSLIPRHGHLGGHSASPKMIIINGTNVESSYASLDWNSPVDVVDRMKAEGVWLLLLASYVDDPLKYQGVDPEDCPLTSSGLILLPVHSEGGSPRKFQRVGLFRIFRSAGVFRNSPEETIIIV